MQSDTLIANMSELIQASLAEAKTQKVDFKILEQQTVSGFMDVAAKLLGLMLEEYDIDSDFVTFEGRQYKKSSTHSIAYFTSAGKVPVKRTNYRCTSALSKHLITPMNLNAGIVNNNWTPQAAKIACIATAEMTPYSAARLFKSLGAMAPSKSSLDRLPKRMLEKIKAVEDSVVQAAIEDDQCLPQETAKVVVSLDGVHIPIQKPRGKKKYKRDGAFSSPTYGEMILRNEAYSRYREASCGTVSYLDENGNLLNTHYYAHMPEEKKESLKKRLSDHIEKLQRQKPDLQMIGIADGAKDNWTFLEDKLSKGVKILDFYHAAEHLKTAMDLLYDDVDEARERFNQYRSILRYKEDGIDQVIQFFEQSGYQNNNELFDREVNYFKTNRERCFYKLFSDKKLPIGSGIVEASCKVIVANRLKQSGMAWRWPGGQAILYLRSLLKSDLFDQLWNCLECQYKRPVLPFQA